MRRFTDIEKKYIQRLCDYAKPGAFYIAANLYYDYFRSNRVAYIQDSKQLIFYRRRDEVTPEEIKKITDEVIEIAFLLDYLEKEELIYYIEDNNNSLESIAVLRENLLQENEYGEIRVRIDDKTANVLRKTMTYRVIAGVTLRAFVENGFKTVDDLQLDEAKIQSETAIKTLKQAKKQTCWSRLAVVVAVITMFATITIQRCSTQSVLVEEVKSPVIQTIKKELLQKHETEKKVLPVAQPEKSDNAKMTSGDKMKKK